MPKREVQIELTLPRGIMRPGDTLVVHAEDSMCAEQVQQIKDHLPVGADLIVISGGESVHVVRGEVRADSRPRCPKCEHVMEGHVGGEWRVCDQEWCSCSIPHTFDQEYGS